MMRRGNSRSAGAGARALAAAGFLALTVGSMSCQDRWDAVPDREGAVKSASIVRAQRVLYDGAPPTIPHGNIGVACASCHDTRGIAVAGMGFAPASPHEDTRKESATLRCRQCHVFVTSNDVFVANSFEGLRQDLRAGGRLYPGAPPTIPHRILMRENCAACHTGPAAREEIRTLHADRTRCRQCHVAVTSLVDFTSALDGGQTAGEGG